MVRDASTRDRVHACSGAPSTFATGPSSQTTPSCSASTRSAVLASTPRSWVMTMTASRSSRRSRLTRSRTAPGPACPGWRSSRRRSARPDRRRAHGRWRRAGTGPRTVARGTGPRCAVPVPPGPAAARSPRRPGPAHAAQAPQGTGEGGAHGAAGIERADRVLRDDLDPPALLGAAFPDRRGQGLSVEGDRSGGGPVEATDAAGEGGLPAARHPEQGQALPRPEAEGDPLDDGAAAPPCRYAALSPSTRSRAGGASSAAAEGAVASCGRPRMSPMTGTARISSRVYARPAPPSPRRAAPPP